MIKADKGDMKIAIPMQSKEREESLKPNPFMSKLKTDTQTIIFATILNLLLPFIGTKIHTNLVMMLKIE